MAKRKRRRGFDLPQRDVLVKPPVAVLGLSALSPDEDPPWKDLYQDAQRQIRELEISKRELIDFGRQTSSLMLSLTKMLIDAKHPCATDDLVTIPRFLHESQLGAGVSVGTDKDGNPFVKLRHRGKARLTPAE